MEFHRDIMQQPGSSVSSGVFLRSDWSREQPPDLSGEVRRSSSRSIDTGYAPSVSASSVSSVGTLCDVCSDSAVKTCLDCMASYCETHVSEHYTSPDLQRHQLQDLQCENLCVEHHRKLELYCRTDRSAICWHCLLYDHRTHDVIEQNPRATSSKSITRHDVPLPGQIVFTAVKSDYVNLNWSPPGGAPGPHRYKVTWRGVQREQSITLARLGLKVTELTPGEKYHFAVATLTEDDHQSSWVKGSVITEVPPPENLTVDVKSLTASLKWTKPAGVDQVSYLLKLFRDQKCIDTIHADSPCYTITDLHHGAAYTISVSTVLSNGTQSKPISQTFKKESSSIRTRLAIIGSTVGAVQNTSGQPCLTLVLLGESGSGKSASGNTILGEKRFISQVSSSPVTTECKQLIGRISGREVKVIDTPDFFNDKIRMASRQMMECRQLCEGGQCVYLLVIQTGRFTVEERDVLERLEKALQTNIRDRAIILFTRGDDLGSQPIDDYFRKTNPYLQQLIKKCGNRYQVFNNKDIRQAERQMSELMDKVIYLMQGYTKKM